VTIIDPFSGPPPKEVPLPRAPLVRVIAQVRFPPIPGVESRETIGAFQKKVRAEFPVARPEQMQSFTISPAGLVSGTPEAVWRFSDIAGQWRASLAPSFLALETTNYTSRADFFGRFESLVRLLEELEPQVVDRIGVRYIDRIVGKELADIARLVRSEVLGISGLPIMSRAQQSLSETVFKLDRAQILARWGRLPQNATVDPNAIEPIADPSWILDLDMFSILPPRPFSVDEVASTARAYSERIYSVFRWVVENEFLERYGGKS